MKKYDYGAEYPLVAGFGVLVGIMAILEFRKSREKSLLEKIFLLIFFASIFLSFIFSQTQNIGFSEVLAFSSMTFFYFIFAYQKIEWKEKFLKVVMSGAFLAVVMAFILFFFREETRMFGPFFNILNPANEWPNAFALFLLAVWPIFVLFAKKHPKWFTVLSLSLVFSALMLTYSRGALIAFGGQVVIMTLFYIKKIKFKTVLTALIIGVFTVGLFFGAIQIRSLNNPVVDLQERVHFGGTEGLTSQQERIDFWKGAIELIKEKPLFGWGPFSFRYAYNPIQKTMLGNSDHPHNIFLKIGAENGLIALGSFLAFLVVLAVTVIKRYFKADEENKNLVLMLSVAVLGMFAHNLIDYNFNFSANLLLLFAYLAFIRSAVIKKADNTNKPILTSILAVLVALVALYECIVFVSYRLFDFEYLKYSFYPRNYYITTAEKAIKGGDYAKANQVIDKQIAANSLDAQGYLLRGTVACDSYDLSKTPEDLKRCKDSYREALRLNPLNDFRHYYDCLTILSSYPTTPEEKTHLKEVQEEAIKLLNIYFDYVQKNIHFTAYTQNVEAASDLIDLLVYKLNADPDLLQAKKKMLQKTMQLRDNRKPPQSVL